LGTLVVTTLLDLSWPMRLGLVAVAVVVGLGYVLWRHRAEIVAESAAPGPGNPEASPQDEQSPPTG
jgi:hypothetical protein